MELKVHSYLPLKLTALGGVDELQIEPSSIVAGKAFTTAPSLAPMPLLGNERDNVEKLNGKKRGTNVVFGSWICAEKRKGRERL